MQTYLHHQIMMFLQTGCLKDQVEWKIITQLLLGTGNRRICLNDEKKLNFK